MGIKENIDKIVVGFYGGFWGFIVVGFLWMGLMLGSCGWGLKENIEIIILLRGYSLRTCIEGSGIEGLFCVPYNPNPVTHQVSSFNPAGPI